MAIARERPYVNGNFQVDLGSGDTDTVRGGFCDVVLPAGCVDAIEYRAGNEKTNESRKLIGSVRYDTLVLRRGLIGELDLYEWWSQARNGDPDVRRNVTVSLLNEDRSAAVWRWKFVNAWPVKYSTSDLSAEGNAVFLSTQRDKDITGLL